MLKNVVNDMTEDENCAHREFYALKKE